MKEKIKNIIKPFLVVIIAGLIVSILYISLGNKEAKQLIKLPKISGDNYSDLEWRVDDLESQVSDLESRIDDLEWRVDDLENLEWEIDDLESRISDLEWQLRY